MRALGAAVEALAAEHRSNLLLAYGIAQTLRALPLGEMLTAISRVETLGPIMDPTLYREKASALREDAAVVRILAKAKRELDSLPWPEASQDDTRVVPGQEVR